MIMVNTIITQIEAKQSQHKKEEKIIMTKKTFNNIEEKTPIDAKVYHDKYFYFDYNGESYRGRWYTSGFSYTGLRLWKKEQLNFIVIFNTWGLAIHDVLKYGTNQLVQDKKEFYNAIKTYDICVAALEETIHTSPHTEKIVR